MLTAVERRSEQTYTKLLKKKEKGTKFTDNERNSHGEIVRPKYELITSHTARRSGTTNLYKLGVLSDQEIRSITGHQSQKVFESYIRIGISEQA